jgi:hypothetical protein
VVCILTFCAVVLPEAGILSASPLGQLLTPANARSTLTAERNNATSTAKAYGTQIAIVPTAIWRVQQSIVDMQATATTASVRIASALGQPTVDAANRQTEDAFSTRAALYQTATAIPLTATPVPPTATVSNALGHLRIAGAEHQVAVAEYESYVATAVAVEATAAAMIAKAQATLPPALQTVEARAAAATATAAAVANIVSLVPGVPSGGVVATSTPSVAGGSAPQPPAAVTGGTGQVLSLAGTPHLWIRDEFGIYHWGGDTRGIADRHVEWNSRRTVSLAELRTVPIGDPWLSSGLVKVGDPIYLSKWETDQVRPVLLHIQSIADVEIFGINATNYGALVLDAPAWEARYGFTVSSLPRATLPRAVG